MLDKEDITSVCGVITTKEILKEISEQELRNILTLPRHYFREDFILVEDIETKKFHESETKYYYATSLGEIYSVTKKGGVKKGIKGYSKHGERTLHLAGDREIRAKNLIAKLFIDEYKEGDVVLLKDDGYYNVSVDNLVVIPKGVYAKKTGPLSRSQAVGLFENNKLVRKWSSARKCAKSLFCSYQTIMDYCNGKVAKPMFDVRWL